VSEFNDDGGTKV